MNEKEQKFVSIINENKRVIHNVINIYCSEKNYREDLFQDIMVRAWMGFGRFKNLSKTSTWIYSISKNVAIDRIRRLETRIKHVLLDNWVYEIINEEGEKEENIPQFILNKLTSKEKQTLDLVLEGFSYKQISEITGESENRIAVRINRIKVNLTKKILTMDKIYDFGGGEQPMDEDDMNIIVIDKITEEEFREYGYTNPYIKANLESYTKLNPVNKMFTNQTAKYLGNITNFARTINDALLPGGEIIINENYFNGWKKTVALVKMLVQTYKFKIKDNNIFYDERFHKLYQRLVDRNFSPKVIEEMDSDDTISGELKFTLNKP